MSKWASFKNNYSHNSLRIKILGLFNQIQSELIIIRKIINCNQCIFETSSVNKKMCRN